MTTRTTNITNTTNTTNATNATSIAILRDLVAYLQGLVDVVAYRLMFG